jgi:hypothetical protein
MKDGGEAEQKEDVKVNLPVRTLYRAIDWTEKSSRRRWAR